MMIGLSCCHPALWIPAYAGMTVSDAGTSLRRVVAVVSQRGVSRPPLWIADQVRNDVVVVGSRYSTWRVPALWILGQV